MTSKSNEMRAKAFVIEQHGKEMVLFKLSSQILRRICYVLPRNKDNPEEIQRVLSPKRLREIGKYVSKPDSLLPNNVVLNLLPSVKIESTGPGEAVVIFPTDGSENEGKTFTDPQNKYAHVIDGQHRIVGFDYAPGTYFDIPVTGLVNEDPAVAAKVFADINSKQVKVGAILLQAIRLQIGDLSKTEEDATKLAARLNKTNGSPFKGMIEFPDSEGSPQVSSVTLSKTLQPLVSPGGALYEVEKENERLAILIQYYDAWRQTFPAAWGSPKHVLTKNIGLFVMTRLAKRIFDNCDRYEGGARTSAAFKKCLKLISRISWKGTKLGGAWGAYSSQGGISLIIDAILCVIREDRKVQPDYDNLNDLAGEEDVEP